MRKYVNQAKIRTWAKENSVCVSADAIAELDDVTQQHLAAALKDCLECGRSTVMKRDIKSAQTRWNI